MISYHNTIEHLKPIFYTEKELQEIVESYLSPEQLITEASALQLLRAASQTDPQRIVKAKIVKSSYSGISKFGELMFSTTSETVPGRRWYQSLEMSEKAFNEIFSVDKIPTYNDMVEAINFSDIRVHCNCPSYKYWAWQYMGTRNNYSIIPEYRAPKRNNVALNGSACKHILSMLLAFSSGAMLKRVQNDIFRYVRYMNEEEPIQPELRNPFDPKPEEEPTSDEYQSPYPEGSSNRRKEERRANLDRYYMNRPQEYHEPRDNNQPTRNAYDVDADGNPIDSPPDDTGRR